VPDPRSRVQVFVAVVVVGGAVLAGVWYGSRPAQPPWLQPPGDVVGGATAPSLITVHVAGAVAEPGLVSIPAGSRIADAVAAAGGAVPGANLGALNLAAPVEDADRVEVPLAGATGATGATGGSDSGIDLNRADATQLETLPGVGPVLAARIVEYRDAHGPFASVEDLLDVPGIGEAKLAALRDAVAAP
jgi:competence protein ComEA